MPRLILLVFLLVNTATSLWAQIEIKPESGRRTRAAMWLYTPPEGTASNDQAVIICPGGSYHHLGIFHEGHSVAKYLASQGFCAYVLRYSTSLHLYHYPTMMEDMLWAMTQAVERAPVWSYSANKIGVMGFSAGGHLVGWLGTYYPFAQVKPSFVAMLYPVVSMKDGIVHEYSRKNLLTKRPSAELIDKMSLECHVHRDMPPVFLVACEDDPLVKPENSILYDQALSAQQVPHQFILYSAGGHGFGYDVRKAISIKWTEAFLAWNNSIFQEK